MSLITDMVIIAPYHHTAAFAKLNEWCRAHDIERQQEFNKIEMLNAGGRKWFTSSIYACSGNYFPYYDLYDAFESFGFPQGTTLWIDHEDSEVRICTVGVSDQ